MSRWNSLFFFFNDTATTEIYTLSLHDALPISIGSRARLTAWPVRPPRACSPRSAGDARARSEEHTSELQSQSNLVCRLLLEKKNYADQLSYWYEGQPILARFMAAAEVNAKKHT